MINFKQRKKTPRCREVLAVVSVFDVEKLRALLKDFYAISRLRITVFDENLSELVSYPEQVAPWCAVIRGTPRGFDACRACDRAACETAAKKHATHVYRCHAGLTEAVTPLYVGEVLAGYLLFGHVFSFPSREEGWAVVEERCRDYQVNLRMLKEAIFAADMVEESFVRSAASILHAMASYLILQRMAALEEQQLAARLDACLSARFTEKLSSAGLAADLGIGRTRLYELSRQLYGCGIAEKIRALRLEKAKALLAESADLPLSEIAARCGFQDYNYFIAVFSRQTGLSPAAWRRKRKEQGGLSLKFAK